MPSLLDIDSFMKSQGTQTNGLGTIPSYKGEDINSLIDEISLTEGVDPELIRAVVKLESGFNPNAKAPTSSASGLMQLVKGTANEMGVQDVFDPRQNLTGGIRYLKKHLDATGGDVDKALRMYNQGPAGDLNKAQGYVDTVKRFYGKDFTTSQISESPTTEMGDMGDLISKYGIDPYPKKESTNITLPNIPQEQPDATDIAQGFDESAIVRGFTQALNGPQPEVGKLPFGVENKGDKISQVSKDILYGLPEGVMNLGAGILGLPAAAIGSVSKLATGSSLEEAGDTFNEIAHTAMGTPQTATAQYMMKPFEVVFGGILNSGAEVVKDLNPTATPQELDSKIKATQYLMNLAMVAPMFKGAVRGKGKVDAENPARSLDSQELSPEVIDNAKVQVLNDPQVAPEIKAQVEGVTPDLLNSIKQKASQTIAKERVQSKGMPEVKFADNQSIVEGLLTEVELREGRAKTTMRKAAKIVAEMDSDVALVDLKGIKGVNPEGSTGKAIARLIEERDASKKIEEIPTTGDDIPIEPVKSLEDIPPKIETPSESVLDINPIQTLVESIDPSLKYDGAMKGIPEAGIPDIHNLTLTLEDGRQPSFSISGEITPDKIASEVQKVKEKFQSKQIEEVIPNGQERIEGQGQGRKGLLTVEEPLPISEFDNINLAIDEGYSFPLKKRFSKLEDAQAKAQSLGEGHEVVKVGDKYRVGKFEEAPLLKEYSDEAALNADGWELMSEIPSERVKFESPSEGFGIAKVGDKYYRISKYVEMPEREVKSDLIPKDKWEDDVSPEDWQALKSMTDEATYNEIVAQDRLKEISDVYKGEEVKDPKTSAQLAEAFLAWRDSFVTKSNIGKNSKNKKATKESLSVVDDSFKTFNSEQEVLDWMNANGKVGEVISDPLTGKFSFLDSEKFGKLDELDAWDEGVEQLSGRRENYSDGMLSSDDLYNVQGIVYNVWGYPFKGEKEFKTGRQFYREVFPVFKLGGEKTSGVKTIGEALDILIKHSDDSVEKRIAEKIYSVIDKDIPIKFEDNGLGKLGLRGKDILGMYSQWESGNPKGFIALATEDSSILSYTPSIGTIARTIVHESAHATLSRALRKGMDDRETSTYSNEAIFAARIDRAYIKAKEVLKDKYPKEYGLSSRNEFLAEALSNNKFQELLKEVKMYNGTVWGKLVESIREFLGFSKEESNAFLKVLDATDRYIDTIKPEMGLSDTGKMDLWSILNNERGSVDITSLRSTVDLIQDTVKAAQKMGKSIDEYLMHIGTDEIAIEAFKSAMAQVPQMKQQLKEKDPVTSAILMPEGKVVAQTINKTRDGKVRSVGPPITEELASKVMNADRTKQWGSDKIYVDPETGKAQVHHTSNMFERFMEATETKINSFRSAGLQDVYSIWREAKSNAEKEKVQIKEWLDDLEKQIAPERREAFALNAYKDMKSVKEAFDAMGISEIPELTLQESKVLEQLLDYTRKFRDRSNYIRTHTGQKAIPQLKDMNGKENYLPLMRDINVLRDMGLAEGLTISDSKKLGELSKKFNGMFNPHSKKRNVSDIPIELDPFKALKRHAEYGIDEIHISPVAALAKDLANLKLPRVDGVKGKISLSDWNPNLSRMLSRWSDQIVGKDIVGTAMANANPFFSKATQSLSRNLVVATIGGSLRTILVQPTSYVIGIPTMLNMRSTAYGLFKLASERPFGKSNARENSSILAIREAEYAYKELADYIQQGKMSGIRAYVADKSLAPMKWVDSIIAEASWNAARYYGEKTLKLQGKELYRFADDIVERTQGMGLKGAVADVQSSAATKWLTLLQTFGISDFNLIARDVLGIKNPEANQSKTIIRVAKYTAATIMTGQLYKMIGLDNVVPDPIGTYEEAKKAGKGDLHAIGMAAAELLEKVPIIGGSAKYGSSLGGIAGEWAEIVPDAAAKLGESLDWKKLTPKQRSYNIRLMARAAGYTLGIPYTNQILKSINSAYKGGNPWEVILGVYEKEKGKKSGSLRPEIPRPPRPSISF